MRVILTFTFCLLFTLKYCYSQVQVSESMTLMGSRFEITIVEQDSAKAKLKIKKAVEEIERIENLISEWRPQTQVSKINQAAGIRPVIVDEEVFELTKRAIYFSNLTGGAFDISIIAMDKIWKFDGSMERKPNPEEVANSIKNVGYKRIELDSIKSSIYLTSKGMKIGFGSIGKGYAADKARELMRSLGVTAGMINASGDIAAWGKQINGETWKIGILNPFERTKMIKVLKFKTSSIATSGSYEKYVEFDGQRYSHIINPKTGYPASELVSVTIWGPSTEFANGLSTSIMVLGKKQGKMLLQRFPKYRAIIIDNNQKISKF